MTSSETDDNWLHVAYREDDVINKVGIGMIAYWAAAREEHPQVNARPSP